MTKNLVILVLLLALGGQVDAQKKYTRKIKIKTENQEENEEEDDDVIVDIAEIEIEKDGEDVEMAEVVINTKPIGKYLERRKSEKTVTMEPMIFLGWNGIDLDGAEANVLGGIQDFSDMNMKAFSSWYVALFPLGIKVNLYQQRLNLVTGLGFQFYNYKFSDSVVFSTVDPYYVSHYTPDKLKKTKLGSSYLSFPLLLEYSSERRNKLSNFSAGVGMLFGYRMKTWTKMKLDNGDKFHGPEGNYNFNNFVYSVAFMVGFRDVKLFGTYMLTPMHRANPGFNVNAYPFSFGLQL